MSQQSQQQGTGAKAPPNPKRQGNNRQQHQPKQQHVQKPPSHVSITFDQYVEYKVLKELEQREEEREANELYAEERNALRQRKRVILIGSFVAGVPVLVYALDIVAGLVA